MSFNLQSTPNYWCDDHQQQQQSNNNILYEDICELNHENINLFNNQQQQKDQLQHQDPDQHQHQHQQSFPYLNTESINNDLYSNNFNNNYGTNLYYENNLNQQYQHQQPQPQPQPRPFVSHHSSSESSPNAKVDLQHSLMSPETSEASAHHLADDTVNNKTKIGGRKVSNVKNKKQLLDEQDAILMSKDDSELNEEELQLKRKAQNRTAQRAFRERKETKLKELEAKLLKSEEERQKLMDQLEIIRKQNLSISSENEVLRSDPNNLASLAMNNHHNNRINKFTFPKTQDDFIKGVIEGTNHQYNNEENKNKIYDDKEGNKLLALGAVWDYLQIKVEEFDLDFNSIDIKEVMNKLKGSEKCHGWGPAYDKTLVDQAIQSCLSSI
ncbi:unnamed protein product [Candida verbasci]|uniref:BZIP domain-containing protein n=1 Tax=Candida verbasci TaxID=1227364 RepID=A0A9W4TZB5_9ASCO|nr:unnamed protein product [Candida verbasci]